MLCGETDHGSQQAVAHRSISLLLCPRKSMMSLTMLPANLSKNVRNSFLCRPPTHVCQQGWTNAHPSRNDVENSACVYRHWPLQRMVLNRCFWRHDGIFLVTHSVNTLIICFWKTRRFTSFFGRRLPFNAIICQLNRVSKCIPNIPNNLFNIILPSIPLNFRIRMLYTFLISQ